MPPADPTVTARETEAARLEAEACLLVGQAHQLLQRAAELRAGRDEVSAGQGRLDADRPPAGVQEGLIDASKPVDAGLSRTACHSPQAASNEDAAGIVDPRLSLSLPVGTYFTTVKAAEYCSLTPGGLRAAMYRGRVSPVGRRGGGGRLMWRVEELDEFVRGGDVDEQRDELGDAVGRHRGFRTPGGAGSERECPAGSDGEACVYDRRCADPAHGD